MKTFEEVSLGHGTVVMRVDKETKKRVGPLYISRDDGTLLQLHHSEGPSNLGTDGETVMLPKVVQVKQNGVAQVPSQTPEHLPIVPKALPAPTTFSTLYQKLYSAVDFTDEEVWEFYSVGGFPVQQIARALKQHPNVIYTRLHRYRRSLGVTSPLSRKALPSQQTKTTPEKVGKLYESTNLSYREVAKQLGVSVATVSKKLQEYRKRIK